MQAAAYTATMTDTATVTLPPVLLGASSPALIERDEADELAVADELVTGGTFQTIEELTAHCTIGYYTSGVCYRSKYNVRPAPADIKADVRELAQLIAFQGLLQNLVGYIDAEGKVAIVAGERRRNAILLNIEEGIFPEDFMIPVLIVTEEEAVQVSLAENSGRKDMHHADISAAMLALRRAGTSVSDIALCFGVDELRVLRRLKLANLSPKIFQLYREDKIGFEQAATYALVDDHETQENTLAALGERAAAHQIRSSLTSQKLNILNDRVVRFVGVKAFEAAGGVVERDLFSERGDGYISDVALLEKLAAEKVAADVERLTAEGFAWVKVDLRAQWSDLQKYTEARTAKKPLTEEQAAEMAALQARQKAIEAEMEALEESRYSDKGDEGDEGDEGSEHADKYAALETEHDEVCRKQDALSDSCEIVIPEDKPLAGALISLEHDLSLRIMTGLIDPEDKKKMVKIGKDNPAAEEVKVKPVHSEALTQTLTSHRTLALRAELMDRPDIAIVMVTHRLACRIFLHGSQTLSSLSWDTASLDKDTEAGKAGQAVAARHAEIKALLPKNVNSKKLLAWMLEQDQAVIWKIFAFCSAQSFSALQQRESESSDGFKAVGEVLNLDMTNWWTADESYFGRVSIARIAEVVSEAVSKDEGAKMLTMKKGVAVKAATELMKDKRWVPSMLRV